MQYLTKDDLEADIQERLLNESSQWNDNLLPPVEKKVIALCKTFLTKYNVEDVFDEDEPIRDEHLVDIMVKIMIYRLIRRNAARKVPTDAKENYDWAMKELEKIQTGRITINLPPAVDGSGNAVSDSMWGNNSNTDFYI